MGEVPLYRGTRGRRAERLCTEGDRRTASEKAVMWAVWARTPAMALHVHIYAYSIKSRLIETQR